MDWSSTLEQLEAMDANETTVALLVLGEVLQPRVRLSITSGLVDLNNYMKRATVRRDVVVQVVRMHRDAGHPDYQHLDMQDVRQRARRRAPTNDPAIPNAFLLSWAKQRMEIWTMAWTQLQRPRSVSLTKTSYTSRWSGAQKP